MNVVQIEYRDAHTERLRLPDGRERVRKVLADYDAAADRVIKKAAAIEGVKRIQPEIDPRCVRRLENELTQFQIAVRRADDEVEAIILDVADEIRARRVAEESRRLAA